MTNIPFNRPSIAGDEFRYTTSRGTSRRWASVSAGRKATAR